MDSPNLLHMLREGDLYMLETRQATLVQDLCDKLLAAVRTPPRLLTPACVQSTSAVPAPNSQRSVGMPHTVESAPAGIVTFASSAASRAGRSAHATLVGCFPEALAYFRLPFTRLQLIPIATVIAMQ
jgi:hypothetical protein